MKKITIGSLFDGSGGFPLAAALHGCIPLWASEIEPYPIAVTRSHFPGMKHLGNVLAVHGNEIDPVDIITFGSPCQDMSIAGKRAGLKHVAVGDEETTRSGLFYEAIRIIREMREATNGTYPTYAVWENVPGALSSNKGEDFRCVLEEFARIKEKNVPIPKPTEGWTTAGEIVGDGYSIAWRVLDAQYWGVPQRRRRIYLVADFADGSAGKILFEREGMPGNPQPGRKERESATTDAPGSVIGGSQLKCVNPWDGQARRLYDPNGVFPALPARERAGQNQQGVHYAVAFMAGQGAKAHGIGAVEDGSPTLKGCPSGLNQAPSVVYPAAGRCYAATRFAEYKEALPTLRASGSDCGGGSEGIIVWPTVARCMTAEADASPCLDRGQNVAVLDCRNLNTSSVSGTLQAKENSGYSLNYQNPVVYDARGHGNGRCVSTLTGDHENRVTDYTSIVAYGGNQSSTLDASYYKGTGSRNGKEREFIAEKRRGCHWIARRLIPTECARLQGFPDCWGILVYKESMTDAEATFWEGVRKTFADATGKRYRPFAKREQLVRWYNRLHTDSSEYKMWGNGIALPCAEFVLVGIVEELKQRFCFMQQR